MRAEAADYCLPCVAHGRLPAHLTEHAQLLEQAPAPAPKPEPTPKPNPNPYPYPHPPMEQAPHGELCRLYDLAARMLLLPDGSDPVRVRVWLG